MSDEMTGQVAPVEANEAAQPEATPENVAAPESHTEGEQEGKAPAAKTFTQEELDAIVQREKAKAEAKAERKALRAYRESITQPQQQARPAPEQAPKRDQFASDEEWIDAKVEHRLRQREAQAASQNQQRQTEELIGKTEKIYAQAAKVPGFDRDAFDELPITPAIAQALIESESAPQLMAYMASNPDDVERIANLSPARQAVELGKLEAKLATAAEKVSKAPPPINPIGGGKSPTVDPAKMSMDDYVKMRAKQGARWAR